MFQITSLAAETCEAPGSSEPNIFSTVLNSRIIPAEHVFCFAAPLAAHPCEVMLES